MSDVQFDVAPKPAFQMSVNGAPPVVFELTTLGARGLPGTDGLSAYEVAVSEGFTGTETEWLASLKGDKGDTGAQGEPGAFDSDIPVNYITLRCADDNTLFHVFVFKDGDGSYGLQLSDPL